MNDFLALDDATLQEALKFAISETQANVGSRFQGKVRDCYDLKNRRILVATDRLSAFDRHLTTIPFKGQLLTAMAVQWFRLVEGVVPHHLEEVIHPNVIVVKRCKVFPVEVVVRGFLAGSALRDYFSEKPVSGVQLERGLKPFQKLAVPVITPSTKGEQGSHDIPISEGELLKKGLVSKEHWERVRSYALMLYEMGSKRAREMGLLLADTKYEFGLDDVGEVTLVDEIHTLDSSRYWEGKSYEERIKEGKSPEMFDKEPVRQWLRDQGFEGEGEVPEIGDSYRVELAKHYLKSFKRLTGEDFVPLTGDQKARIENLLKERFGAAQ